MTGDIHYLPLHSGDQIASRDERDWVTSYELVDEAHITYRQLDYWTRTNLMFPLDAANPGSGYLRRYDHAQIQRAATLRALVDVGISLQTCRQIIDDFLADGHIDLGPFTLTTHEGAQSA